MNEFTYLLKLKTVQAIHLFSLLGTYVVILEGIRYVRNHVKNNYTDGDIQMARKFI